MTDEKLRRILDDKKLCMMLKEASPQQEIERLRAEIARLRLTDKEREAIKEAADSYDDGCNERCREITKILRGLLERLGGER